MSSSKKVEVMNYPTIYQAREDSIVVISGMGHFGVDSSESLIIKSGQIITGKITFEKGEREFEVKKIGRQAKNPWYLFPVDRPILRIRITDLEYIVISD